MSLPLPLLQERLESKAAAFAESEILKMEVGSRVTLSHCFARRLSLLLHGGGPCLPCSWTHLPALPLLTFKPAGSLPLCCILASSLVLRNLLLPFMCNNCLAVTQLASLCRYRGNCWYGKLALAWVACRPHPAVVHLTPRDAPIHAAG